MCSPPSPTLERLADRIAELAAHIAAATCHWLELVAEFDALDGQHRWGFQSCAEWLAWCCSLSPEAAREHVRVARRLRELPRARELFSRGELTYSKVRALSRIATAENEECLIEYARHATAAQLERIVRSYRRAPLRPISPRRPTLTRAATSPASGTRTARSTSAGSCRPSRALPSYRRWPRAPHGHEARLRSLTTARAGHIKSDACFPLGGGERFDLGLTVEALLGCNRRARAPST